MANAHCTRVALAALLPLLAHRPAPQDPAPTAGDAGPVGTLRFEIVDEAGQPIPGRLTFTTPAGDTPELFPGRDARPQDLAVRRNVVATLSGRGAITVPVGRWVVHASRGLEWSLATTELDLAEGATVDWRAELRREVDTTGWVSGDFHLHTLTYSGHGDANLDERVVTLIAEGVELAVATDHNHHTDYGPTIEALGAGEHVTAVTGNEVSTPIGHFNAFPLKPDRAPVDAQLTDGGELFRLIRAEPNRFDVVPVVQLNHPRWGSIDWFGKTGLDPVTGTSQEGAWSDDFDALEVFNANEGWGYPDAETDPGHVGESRHSVLRDWYHLLDRGHRYAAVGNSDSHRVLENSPGWPRNFLPSSTDDAAAIDPAEIAARLRERRAFTTFGPFVELSVGGVPMGGDATATDGRLEVALRIQAASWIDCDRALIVANGEVVHELAIPDARDPVRLDETVTLSLPHDAWIAVRVEGDDPLAPIVSSPARPVRPWALTNPVWVDADGDGEWTSPWARAQLAVREAAALVELDASPRLGGGPSERARALLAASERRPAWALDLVRRELGAREREVLLAAARAAERLVEPALVPTLEQAWARDDLDAYARIALLRAMAAAGSHEVGERLVALLAGPQGERARVHADELEPLLPGEPVTAWLACGPFPGTDLAQPAPDDAPWVQVEASGDGRVDLNRLDGDPDAAEAAHAFLRTYVHTPYARRVAFALGSDDGCRLTVNGALVLEDPEQHALQPLRHVAHLPLDVGWNELVLAVENGEGGFGASLRLFESDLRASTVPESVLPPPPIDAPAVQQTTFADRDLESPDERYVAEIRRAPGQERVRPELARWRVAVFARTRDGGRSELWSGLYPYRGDERLLFLSQDGRAIVDVAPLYQDYREVVGVFRPTATGGERVAIDGAVLGVPREARQRTDRGVAWLAEDPTAHVLHWQLTDWGPTAVLELALRDGGTLPLDVDRGARLVLDTPAEVGVDPPFRPNAGAAYQIPLVESFRVASPASWGQPVEVAVQGSHRTSGWRVVGFTLERSAEDPAVLVLAPRSAPPAAGSMVAQVIEPFTAVARVVGLPPGTHALQVASGAAEPLPAQEVEVLPPGLLVELHASGGIAGIVEVCRLWARGVVTIESSRATMPRIVDLWPEQEAELDRLLAQLPRKPTRELTENASDLFHCELVVWHDGRSTTHVVDDLSARGAIADVIQLLRRP